MMLVLSSVFSLQVSSHKVVDLASTGTNTETKATKKQSAVVLASDISSMKTSASTSALLFTEVQNYTLDVVYRLPNQDACYAPYAFVGGGSHANGSNEGILRAGVGIDYKISDASSLFTDGAYNWVGGDVEEYITVRAGLRFNF